MSKREIILSRSTTLFFEQGFYKLSMEELASTIGIAKKTIYNNFGSKDKLLEQILTDYLQVHLGEITTLLEKQDMNVIEKVKQVFNTLYPFYTSLERPLSLDPDAVRFLNSEKCLLWNNQIINAIENMAAEAAKQGLIKKGIRTEILPHLFINIIDSISSWKKPQNAQFTSSDFLKQTITIVLDGIFTHEAMEEFLKI